MKDSSGTLSLIVAFWGAVLIALNAGAASRAVAADLAITSTLGVGPQQETSLPRASGEPLWDEVGPAPLLGLDPTEEPDHFDTGPVEEEDVAPADDPASGGESSQSTPATEDAAADIARQDVDSEGVYRYEYPGEECWGHVESGHEADHSEPYHDPYGYEDAEAGGLSDDSDAAPGENLPADERDYDAFTGEDEDAEYEDAYEITEDAYEETYTDDYEHTYVDEEESDPLDPEAEQSVVDNDQYSYDYEEWEFEYSDNEYEDGWVEDEFHPGDDSDSAPEATHSQDMDKAVSARDYEAWYDEYGVPYEEHREHQFEDEFSDNAFETAGDIGDAAYDLSPEDLDQPEPTYGYEEPESEYGNYDDEDRWAADDLQAPEGDEAVIEESGLEAEGAAEDEQGWETGYGEYEYEYEYADEYEYAEEYKYSDTDFRAVRDAEAAEAEMPATEEIGSYQGYSDAYPYEEFAYPEDKVEEIGEASAPNTLHQDESGSDLDFGYEPYEYEFLCEIAYSNACQQDSELDQHVESEPANAKRAGPDGPDAVAAAARVVDVMASLASRSLTTLGGAVRSASRRFSEIDWAPLSIGPTEGRAAGRARASDDPIQR